MKIICTVFGCSNLLKRRSWKKIIGNHPSQNIFISSIIFIQVSDFRLRPLYSKFPVYIVLGHSYHSSSKMVFLVMTLFSKPWHILQRKYNLLIITKTGNVCRWKLFRKVLWGHHTPSRRYCHFMEYAPPIHLYFLSFMMKSCNRVGPTKLQEWKKDRRWTQANWVETKNRHTNQRNTTHKMKRGYAEDDEK